MRGAVLQDGIDIGQCSARDRPLGVTSADLALQQSRVVMTYHHPSHTSLHQVHVRGMMTTKLFVIMV